MNNKENCKYHFFVIINNEEILGRNTKKSLEEYLKHRNDFEIHYSYNMNNEFVSIRDWINNILNKSYQKHQHYDGSKFIFIHQDVILYDNFLDELELFLNYEQDKINFFGFAGIDSQGVHHKYMIDSGEFCFTNDLFPIEVDSVDEFLFGFDFNLFYKEQILLSSIKGWHAYSAEFSLILKNKGINTYMLPIFTEHNSIRTNNHGVYKTHDELFNIYGIFLRTLVGTIQHKTFLKKVKLSIYGVYVNLFKWKYRSKLILNIKSLFLDNMGISFNENRLKQNLVKKFEKVKYFHFAKECLIMQEREIILPNTIVKFKTINNLDEISYQKEDCVIISGLDIKLDGFSFNGKINLNLKKGKTV